jgi:hypothetical protein
VYTSLYIPYPTDSSFKLIKKHDTPTCGSTKPQKPPREAVSELKYSLRMEDVRNMAKPAKVTSQQLNIKVHKVIKAMHEWIHEDFVGYP